MWVQIEFPLFFQTINHDGTIPSHPPPPIGTHLGGPMRWTAFGQYVDCGPLIGETLLFWYMPSHNWLHILKEKMVICSIMRFKQWIWCCHADAGLEQKLKENSIPLTVVPSTPPQTFRKGIWTNYTHIWTHPATSNNYYVTSRAVGRHWIWLSHCLWTFLATKTRIAGISVNTPCRIRKPIAVPRLQRRKILLWNALIVIRSSNVVACCPIGSRSTFPHSTRFWRFPK